MCMRLWRHSNTRSRANIARRNPRSETRTISPHPKLGRFLFKGTQKRGTATAPKRGHRRSSSSLIASSSSVVDIGRRLWSSSPLTLCILYNVFSLLQSHALNHLTSPNFFVHSHADTRSVARLAISPRSRQAVTVGARPLEDRCTPLRSTSVDSAS